MAEDGKIVYKITVDDSGAIVAAERAGKKVKEKFEDENKGPSLFEKMMTGAAHRIGAAFVDMAARAVDGVKEITKAGVEFNAKMQKYQTAFTTLLGDAQEAERVMAQIRQDAAATPFDVDGLTQANQLLISAGVSADDARNDVLNLANAIAATGGGNDELSRMAANLQQIRNTGKATAVDIKQFAFAGINIYGLLADYMGVTTEQAAEMDVTYEQLAGALAHAAEAGGMYAGALEAQAATFNGQISTLKDNAEQLAGTLTEGLFTTLAETALPMVNDWINTILEAAQTGGIEGAMEAAHGILSSIITSLVDNLPQMVDAGMTMLEGLLNGISNAIPDILPMAVYIITTIVSSLISHLPELVAVGFSLLTAVLQGLLQAFPQLWNGLDQIIVSIWTALMSIDWVSIGTNVVNGIWAGIVSLWDWLVNMVHNAVTQLWTAAKDALGIHSPSTKFAWIAKMSVEGGVEGWEDNEDELIRTVRTVYGHVADTAEDALITAPGIDNPTTFPGLDSIERNVSFNLAATGSGGAREIIVPLYINDREFARATAWDMGEQLAWREV